MLQRVRLAQRGRDGALSFLDLRSEGIQEFLAQLGPRNARKLCSRVRKSGRHRHERFCFQGCRGHGIRRLVPARGRSLSLETQAEGPQLLARLVFDGPPELSKAFVDVLNLVPFYAPGDDLVGELLASSDPTDTQGVFLPAVFLGESSPASRTTSTGQNVSGDLTRIPFPGTARLAETAVPEA